MSPAPLQSRELPRLLSLVVPAYNEGEVFPLLKERLATFVSKCPVPCEILLVNDGSADNTEQLIEQWAQQASYVRGISFARNFGHQMAVTAGLEAAAGEAVVVLDADLQDPPEVILEMLDKYGQGYDVVYGRRSERQGESIFKRATAYLFYRLLRFFIHPDLPVDAGDFRLMSRPAVDALLRMPERHRFLRGMVAWLGFAQTEVIYSRDKRQAGSTKYPFRKMAALAWNASVSFSPLPLRISLMIGVAVAIFGGFYFLYTLYHTLILKDTVPGWPTVVSLLCLIGGSILVSVGILGEYVAKIFEEVKARPLYVIKRRINFPQPESIKHQARE